MDISRVIYHIKNDNLSKEEIIEYLNIPQKFIISNAIIKLLKLKMDDKRIIKKLVDLTKYNGKEHEFTESITLRHLATAALFIINTSDSEREYGRLNSTYNDGDKQKTIHAIEILKDLCRV